MQAYFWIAIGSALGGIARHWCTTVGTRVFGVQFPWGTLIVNVVGSLIIGFLAHFVDADHRYSLTPTVRQFLMVGFCGGYTTFSAFSLQTLALLQTEDWFRAGAYVLASVLLCVLAAWLGHLLAVRVSLA